MTYQGAIFLDRDNTLIWDPGYISDPALVRLLPGVVPGLQRLQQAGYPLIIISNQAGIGRGYYTAAELALVHARLEQLLAAEGVTLYAAYYCHHAPWEACPCRKPAPGLLLQAAAEHQLDLGQSWMIGDKPSDTAAGRRAGCRTLLLDDEAPVLVGDECPDAVVADLEQAAMVVLAALGGQ